MGKLAAVSPGERFAAPQQGYHARRVERERGPVGRAGLPQSGLVQPGYGSLPTRGAGRPLHQGDRAGQRRANTAVADDATDPGRPHRVAHRVESAAPGRAPSRCRPAAGCRLRSCRATSRGIALFRAEVIGTFTRSEPSLGELAARSARPASAGCCWPPGRRATKCFAKLGEQGPTTLIA
jgi:hypothetical protein